MGISREENNGCHRDVRESWPFVNGVRPVLYIDNTF